MFQKLGKNENYEPINQHDSCHKRHLMCITDNSSTMSHCVIISFSSVPTEAWSKNGLKTFKHGSKTGKVHVCWITKRKSLWIRQQGLIPMLDHKSFPLNRECWRMVSSILALYIESEKRSRPCMGFHSRQNMGHVKPSYIKSQSQRVGLSDKPWLIYLAFNGQ